MRPYARKPTIRPGRRRGVRPGGGALRSRPGSEGMADPRPHPAPATGGGSRLGRHFGSTRQAPLGRRRALRRQGPRGLEVPEGRRDRGNSGVFLMGRYEVQVLDSYNSVTYADGQAGALYGQSPPLVNASRPPGQWQSYDIVWEAPRFDKDGKLARPARATVFHNGLVVQHATVLTGPTAHKARPPYAAHADKLPIGLQDHSHPVRFRNVWVRELKERP